jgi:hypothetical protein
MGDIMARHGGLAAEYARLLVSYVDKKGNFLEHEMLQRGVLWGLGRLAHARPALIKHAVPLLIPFMRSKDPYHRGLAAWAVGGLAPEKALRDLDRLFTDDTTINIFLNNHLLERSVAEIAKEGSCRKPTTVG